MAFSKAFNKIWAASGLEKELSGVFTRTGKQDFKQYMDNQFFSGGPNLLMEDSGENLRNVALNFLQDAKDRGMGITDFMKAHQGRIGGSFQFQAQKNSSKAIDNILANRENVSAVRAGQREVIAQRNFNELDNAARAPGYHGNDPRVTQYGQEVGKQDNYSNWIRSQVDAEETRLHRADIRSRADEIHARNESYNGLNDEGLSNWRHYTDAKKQRVSNDMQRRDASRERAGEYQAQQKGQLLNEQGRRDYSNYVQEQRLERKQAERARKAAGADRRQRMETEDAQRRAIQEAQRTEAIKHAHANSSGETSDYGFRERYGGGESVKATEQSEVNVGGKTATESVEKQENATGEAVKAAEQAKHNWNSKSIDRYTAKVEASGKNEKGSYDFMKKGAYERLANRTKEALSNKDLTLAQTRAIMKEAQQGPTTMDYIIGNNVHGKAAGVAIGAGVFSAIMGDGRRSNVELYSSPF